MFIEPVMFNALSWMGNLSSLGAVLHCHLLELWRKNSWFFKHYICCMHLLEKNPVLTGKSCNLRHLSKCCTVYTSTDSKQHLNTSFQLSAELEKIMSVFLNHGWRAHTGNFLSQEFYSWNYFIKTQYISIYIFIYFYIHIFFFTD